MVSRTHRGPPADLFRRAWILSRVRLTPALTPLPTSGNPSFAFSTPLAGSSGALSSRTRAPCSTMQPTTIGPTATNNLPFHVEGFRDLIARSTRLRARSAGSSAYLPAVLMSLFQFLATTGLPPPARSWTLSQPTCPSRDDLLLIQVLLKAHDDPPDLLRSSQIG